MSQDIETEPSVKPSSDYIALQSFDELPLSEPVRASIARKGYTRPTPVQAAALQPILSGRDVMVRSKTGTGKTAAFGIPVVELVQPGQAFVQAIVLCNTRELAIQVADEIASLGEQKGVRVAPIYGGASMDRQMRALEDGAHVVVGTPGRVIDLLQRKILSLARTRLAVLDEADEMLGEGFFEDVMRILDRCEKGHQTLLFSATLTPDLEQLIRTHLREPETILLSGDVYTVEGIRHVRYFARDEYPKPRNLLYMLQFENPESAIIFCNTRDDVNLVATVLERNGFDAERLSGELAQNERERVMARVKRGEVRFMVATDLAARGIDISDLTHVINYSLPEDPSVYLHRVGRTGRIGKTGTALSLVRGTELVTLTALEKRFGIKFEEKHLPTPEEAHRLWVDTHLAEMRPELGTLTFDAYVSLARELRKRDDGDIFLAFALKYFFTHHRKEKLAGERTDANARSVQNGRQAAEERPKREKPKAESAPRPETPVANGAKAPRAKAEPADEPAPVRKNRLFVGVGLNDGLDPAALTSMLAELSGASADAITQVDVKPAHSYVEVMPDAVDSFLAGNGRSWGEKTVTVEVARPPARRRRRPAESRRGDG